MLNNSTTGPMTSATIPSASTAPGTTAAEPMPTTPATASCPLTNSAQQQQSSMVTTGPTASTGSAPTLVSSPAWLNASSFGIPGPGTFRYGMPFERSPVEIQSGVHLGGSTASHLAGPSAVRPGGSNNIHLGGVHNSHPGMPSSPTDGGVAPTPASTVDDVEGILRSLLEQVASSRRQALYSRSSALSSDQSLRRNLFAEIPQSLSEAAPNQQILAEQFPQLVISPRQPPFIQCSEPQPTISGLTPPPITFTTGFHPQTTTPSFQSYHGGPMQHFSSNPFPQQWPVASSAQQQGPSIVSLPRFPHDLVRDRELEQMRAQMREMSSQLHQAIRAAPEVDRVLRETQSTPFTQAITSFPLRNIGKMTIPTYDGTTDPSQYLTTFVIAMGRARFAPEEKDAGYCQLLVENLRGAALRWFTKLKPNTISSFQELSTAFVAQYLMFVEKGASTSDLWTMAQEPKESLRKFIERFKKVASRISIPDGAGLAALNHALLYAPEYRKHLHVNKTQTLEDALHQAVTFIELEEDEARLAKRLQALHPPARSAQTKEPTAVEPRQHINKEFTGNRQQHPRPVLAVSDRPQQSTQWNKYVRDKTKTDDSFCDYHKIPGHSNNDCRALQRYLLQKFQRGEIEDPNLGINSEETPQLALANREAPQPNHHATNTTTNKRPREPAVDDQPPKARKFVN